MDDIEKKAQELLKAECPHLKDEAFEYGSMMTVINLHVVMRALRAALAIPEGDTLLGIPVVIDESMAPGTFELRSSGGRARLVELHTPHLG